jgi:hypothetical protein
MIEGSGSMPLTMDTDPDPGSPKTYGSDGFGSGSATLLQIEVNCVGVYHRG